MATTSNELAMLKAKVESAKVEYDRAVGRMEAMEAQLKAEGFSHINELIEEINRLESEKDELKSMLEEGISQFKEEYGDLLK